MFVFIREVMQETGTEGSVGFIIEIMPETSTDGGEVFIREIKLETRTVGTVFFKGDKPRDRHRREI